MLHLSRCALHDETCFPDLTTSCRTERDFTVAIASRWLRVSRPVGSPFGRGSFFRRHQATIANHRAHHHSLEAAFSAFWRRRPRYFPPRPETNHSYACCARQG